MELKGGYLKGDLKLFYLQNEKFALCLETKHSYGSFCIPKCNAKRLILTLMQFRRRGMNKNEN